MKKQIIYHVRNTRIFVLLLILAVSVGSATYIQFLKGQMFQQAVSGQSSQLLVSFLFFALFMTLEVAFYYVEWQYENSILSQTFFELKKSVLSTATRFKPYHSKDPDKEATQYLTNSIDSLEYPYYNAWFDNFYLGLRIIFVFFAIAAINWILAVIILALMFIPLAVTQFAKGSISKLNKQYMDQVGANLKRYENIFLNILPIHIFNLRDFVLANAEKPLETERDLKKRSKSRQFTLNTSYSYISYFSNFVVLVFSLLMVSHGQMKLSAVITLLGLVDQLSMPILSLSRNSSSINSTKAIRTDIDQYIVQNADASRPTLAFSKTISLKNVAVQLADHKAAYQDLQFAAGHSYLIHGKSGIGKTLFLKLLTGLQPYDTGSIKYDDVDLDRAADKNVFQDMRFVQAENDLFAGSVLKNIFFDRTPSKAELTACAKLLKSETLEAADASKLSTGEKRRVLLLRGLMSNSHTLILDEPTANLDANTSAVFWNMLFDWFNQGQRTMIVVSHTIDDASLNRFDTQLNFNALIKS